MDERVKKDMAGLAAAIDYDAELMLRVKVATMPALACCSKSIGIP